MKIGVNKIYNYIFYFAYFLMLLSDMFSEVKYVNNYLNYIDYISIILLLFLIILENRESNIKFILFSFILLILGFISVYFSNNKELLKLFLLIISFRKINFDKFIKTDFIIKSCLIILVLLFNYLGFTNKIEIYRDGIFRNSFGFSHPNKLGLYLMMVCLDLYYIYRNKNMIFPLIISLLISLFIYLFVDSRTSIVIILIIPVLIFITRRNYKLLDNKLVEFVLKNMFLIITFITIILSLKVNSNIKFISNLNELLSYRLTLNNYFLNIYDINLFGNYVKTDGIYILDSSYINILLRFGIILFIFIYYCFNKSIKIMYKEKNYCLIIIFLVLFIYGFSESFLYKISANAFLLYFSNIYKKG